jgi:hypothetical protein
LTKTFTRLGVLFSADALRRVGLTAAFEEGVLNAAQAKAVNLTVRELCQEIFEEQIELLVDGLGFPDYIVQAPIGRADGNIYQGEAFDDFVKSVSSTIQ